MSAPVDVLAVMDAATSRLLAAGESTGESVAARAAVAELVDAARFASEVLCVGGAPTRSECEEMIFLFGAVLAKFGGGK